jgi:FkbM family methyltransferase
MGLEYIYVADDPWMRQVLEKLKLNENDCILDIGVNIGQTFLNIKSVHPNIKIIGFEPNPYCIYYLSDLIEANNLRNISLYNIALSDQSGTGTLYLQDTFWDVRGTLIEGFRKNSNSHAINIVKCRGDEIDEIISTKNIRLIKVDVEGSELKVIHGLTKIIKKAKPFIICEILPVYNETNTLRYDNQKEIEALLKKINYGIYLIEKDRNNNFISLIKLKTIPVHNDPDRCEYLFMPIGQEKLPDTRTE